MIQKFRRLRLGAWVARHLRTLFGLTLTKTDRGPWRLAWRASRAPSVRACLLSYSGTARRARGAAGARFYSISQIIRELCLNS